MKKKFLGVIFFAAAFFPVNFPNISYIDYGDVMQVKTNSSFATYSDSAYAKEEINFSPGQTIFVKASLGSSQEAVAALTLLNSSKKEIKAKTMSINGQDFTGYLVAPSTPGVYYVHLEVKGEGLSFSGERNVNVAGVAEQEHSKVKVKAESTVISDLSAEKDQIETSSPSQTQKAKPENAFNIAVFVKNKIIKVINWIKNVLTAY